VDIVPFISIRGCIAKIPVGHVELYIEVYNLNMSAICDKMKRGEIILK
jgi:hypothetical protein